MAILWISEWLSAFQWLAIGIILLGVDIVLRARRKNKIQFSLPGVGFAALAALCQAAGAVMSRDVLLNSDIDLVTASLVRLLGGILFIVPALLLSQQRWLPRRQVNAKAWQLMFIATFFGTFVAMLLQMTSFANTEAAIAQSLFASCIIFSLLITKLQGQTVSHSAWWGSLIAVGGVGMIFFF